MKSKIQLPVFVVFILLFAGCNQHEPEVSECEFGFPNKIEGIDTLVYDEIKRACIENWDFCSMHDSTFKVYPVFGGYYNIECDGLVNSELIRFVIAAGKDGKLISKYTLPQSPCYSNFRFPEVDFINPEIYREIKLTCDRTWELCNMLDSTIKITCKNNGSFSARCIGYVDYDGNGLLDDGLFDFGIAMYPDGRWGNNGYTKYNQDNN